MKKSIFQFSTKIWPLLVLLLLWGCVVATNYTPGTWLIGWDNLLPEINLRLNLTRSLFAVWQDYQGLGLLGGIAHASELTRQILLIPLVLVLPTSMVRYAWTFLMLLIGPLGAYFLLQTIFQKQKSVDFSLQLAGLTGSIFYLLNLATVQYFYAPLESFSSFYGFLPWLLYSFISFLQKPTQKRLVCYGVVSLLATSAFHVQTLFITYSIVLGLLSIEHTIRKKMTGFVSVFKLGLVTFLVNAFWLLPILFFTITNSSATVQSKQNLISTPETQLQNYSAGALENIIQLKGYWFDLTDYDTSSNQTVYMLEPWREHVAQPYVRYLTISLFVLSIIGYIATLSQKRNSFTPAFLLTLLFSLSMISAGNGQLGLVYNFLKDNLPLFGQIFRVAFTKWSMVTALTYAIGLGLFVLHFPKILKFKAVVATATSALIITISAVICLPVFSGQLIYDRTQLSIPSEYFELFDYLQNHYQQEKIVHLPLSSFWGWQFNAWGYRGSGFLWYGIKQPIIDRNFDVWSYSNEQLFHQLNTAIVHQDKEMLLATLSKYSLQLFLVDSSLTHEQSSDAQVLAQTYSLLQKIQAKKVWESGSLSLYELPASTSTNSALLSYENLPRDLTQDPQFISQGNYYSTNNQERSVFFPFASLHSEQLHNISENNQQLTIEVTIPQDSQNSQSLIIPQYESGENSSTNASISYSDKLLTIHFPDQITLTAGKNKLSLPQIQDIYIETEYVFPSIEISINDQVKTIRQGETLPRTVLNFVIGETITVNIINTEKIYEENGEKFAKAEDVQKIELTEAWRDFQTAQTITLSPETEQINATIASQPLVFNLHDWGYVQNCDPLNRGTARKLINNDSVLYQANHFGTTCVGFSLLGVSNQQDHILAISSNSSTGAPLRFYLENISSQQSELDQTVSLGNNYYPFFASPAVSDLGYYLTFLNKSLGAETENQLQSVSIYSTNLAKLSEIMLTSNEITKLKVNSADNSRKLGNFFIQTTASPLSLLTLSQSFDEGWLAFQLPCEMVDLKCLGDILTGNQAIKRLEHVKYNGWANGWLVGEDLGISDKGLESDSSLTPNPYGLITIIFWPQLLEFLGLGLLATTTTTLVTKMIWSKH